MEPSRKEMIEKFFRRANIVVNIDKSPVAEVSCKKGVLLIDVKNPLLLMSLGLDMDFLKKREKKSVIRKAVREMGFRIKLRYKLFEVEL